MQSDCAADIVFLNGKIYTQNAAQPWAEAVAIKDGEIAAVGSNSEVTKYRGSMTQVVDVAGRMVLPGFVDSHIHFLLGSLNLKRWALMLDTAETIGEVQKRVKRYVSAHPEEMIITGYGWMYALFGESGLPHKKYLDEIVCDRPVILIAYGGHTTWANSRALELAGVTDETPTPPNGEIVRDPISGEATGVFKEDAEALVHKLLPKNTDEDPMSAVLDGLKLANSFGITRVHSAGQDAEQVEMYDAIRARNLLTVRFYFALFVAPPAVTLEIIEKAEALRRTYHDEWLSGGAIKMYSDGIIESHTAAMLCCYCDDPRNSGSLNWTAERYQEAINEFDRRGFQVWTHSIGDKGIRSTLDAYEEAGAQNKRQGARHRIEHVEVPDAADIPRFGKLNVIASMQPLHAYPNANILGTWTKHVGPDRARNAWPCRDLLDAQAHVAFGSDWPIVTPDPWKAIQTLLTRQTVDGSPPGGWIPHQRINLKQAIHGYTLGAAYAAFLEKTEGSIEPGKVADLIVISQNLFEVPITQIHKTRVLYTVVGGKIVYEGSDQP